MFTFAQLAKLPIGRDGSKARANLAAVRRSLTEQKARAEEVLIGHETDLNEWTRLLQERDIAAAEAAWAVSRELLRDPSIGLVVLDELNIALKHGYLDLDQVLSDLQARPPMQHVIVTGRAAKPEMIEMGDTVTEMGMLKHAFQAGIKAQKGVEL